MAHACRGILLTAVLLGLLAGAGAGEDIGHFCWQTNFIDTIRLSVEVRQGVPQLLDLVLYWHAPTLYDFLGIMPGVVRLGPPDVAEFEPVTVRNTSGVFNAHPLCQIQLNDLPLATLQGTWRILCTTGPNPPFEVVGTMAPVHCSTIGSFTQELAGRTPAGAPENNIWTGGR